MDGITRFNLKDENEEGDALWNYLCAGYYDGNGDFIWKKNKDEEEIEADPFLRDLDKNGLAKVTEKKEEKETKTVSQNMQFVRLASYLQDGETPMQAIHRLGDQGRKKPKSNRRRMPYDDGNFRICR